MISEIENRKSLQKINKTKKLIPWENKSLTFSQIG